LYEWYHPLYIGPNPAQYVDQVMLPQLYDLVNSYKPELIWADGNWEHESSFWRTPEFIAWLYNESPVKDTVVVNDRWGSETPTKHGGYYTPEYSDAVYLNHTWEENSGIDIHSYGFNRATPANMYNTAKDLLNLLVRTVAFGGNLLLDIGPNGDGRIPALMQERLLSIGDWLKINGEAIYSTRKWRKQQENVINNPIQFSQVLNNTDNIYGQVCPGCNTSSIFFAGSLSSNDLCQAVCLKRADCLSYVWHSSAQSNGDYKLHCYVRTDDVWSPTPGQPDHISGRKDHYSVFYTSKGTGSAVAVYALFNSWTLAPLSFTLPIPSAQTKAVLLGTNKELAWRGAAGKAGITVDLPPVTPDSIPGQYIWTVKFTNIS